MKRYISAAVLMTAFSAGACAQSLPTLPLPAAPSDVLGLIAPVQNALSPVVTPIIADYYPMVPAMLETLQPLTAPVAPLLAPVPVVGPILQN